MEELIYKLEANSFALGLEDIFHGSSLDSCLTFLANYEENFGYSAEEEFSGSELYITAVKVNDFKCEFEHPGWILELVDGEWQAHIIVNDEEWVALTPVE